ncbi:MAG: hypothetical protein Q9162_006423 [Coniocarpon cinnabarinum]
MSSADGSPIKDKDELVPEHLEKTGTLSSVDDVSELDRTARKRLDRRFDKHILPWLFGLWLLAFIDRSNIGNARIDGLADDLHLNEDKFNITLAVFYIPYICVDVPSNWIVKRLGAGYYLPGIVAAWGVVSLCIGFVTTYTGLIVARFFLGLCEGGLLGGMIIYLAMFYERRQLVRRITLFYCAAPLSGAFGGLLATGLAEIKTDGYDGWPFIFFLEGAITLIFGLVTIAFLPHTPAHAKFLSQDERDLAAKRMAVDAAHSTTTGDVKEEKFDWHWVRMALLNWNTILLSLNFFAIITPIYSYSLFLPTIIRDLGYSRVNAQLLTVPPNFAAFLVVPAVGYISDRYGVRGPFMLCGLLLALIGYLMLISTGKPHINYGGTFFVASGIFPTSPLVMGWLANNLSPHYVRATGTGFQIMIANLAAFIATFTYLQEDAPRYITGHAINIGMLGLSAILCTILIIYQKWENRLRAQGKRDYRLQESSEERAAEMSHDRDFQRKEQIRQDIVQQIEDAKQLSEQAGAWLTQIFQLAAKKDHRLSAKETTSKDPFYTQVRYRDRMSKNVIKSVDAYNRVLIPATGSLGKMKGAKDFATSTKTLPGLEDPVQAIERELGPKPGPSGAQEHQGDHESGVASRALHAVEHLIPAPLHLYQHYAPTREETQ